MEVEGGVVRAAQEARRAGASLGGSGDQVEAAGLQAAQGLSGAAIPFAGPASGIGCFAVCYAVVSSASYARDMSKQTNIRLDDSTRAAAEDRAKRRGLSLQGYVADLIEQDVNESRAAFMAAAQAFLASYAAEFEAEFGEDRYPGLGARAAADAPRNAA